MLSVAELVVCEHVTRKLWHEAPSELSPLGPVLGYIVFILRNIADGRVFGGMIGLLGLPFAYLLVYPLRC